MGRVALVLIAIGVVVFAWYAGWGVKSCDDFGGNPMCDRMDRDSTIYLIGLGMLSLGLMLGAFALVRRQTRKLDGVQSQ